MTDLEFDELAEQLATFERFVRELPANDVVLTPRERINLYTLAVVVLDRFQATVRNTLRPDAIQALYEAEIPEGEWVETPTGFVRRTRVARPAKYAWAGWALCDGLAQDVVDGNGERIRAVPVDVLREPVAACSRPELTSSKWVTAAVSQRVGSLDVYREQTERARWEDSIEVDR